MDLWGDPLRHTTHTSFRPYKFLMKNPMLKLKRGSLLSSVHSPIFLLVFKRRLRSPQLVTMVARAAAKKGSVWLSDPSTYPLLAALGVATVMCLSTGVRHLTASPDVKWDREVRKNPEMALKDRSDWRSHRKFISSMHSNAVNAYHDK